jgi:hypothetical protein
MAHPHDFDQEKSRFHRVDDSIVTNTYPVRIL